MPRLLAMWNLNRTESISIHHTTPVAWKALALLVLMASDKIAPVGEEACDGTLRM
jgi:hypothetical protein